MRDLDYIDARLMAKAIARWRVVGDLSDEQLQEDSVACRYLNRRIAELTEDHVPDAVAAIKALGADPSPPRFTDDDIKAIAMQAMVRAEGPPPGWRWNWLSLHDSECIAFTRAVISVIEHRSTPAHSGDGSVQK